MVTTPFLASLISKKIELKAYKAGHCLLDISIKNILPCFSKISRF
jgi:hypothetical protein